MSSVPSKRRRRREPTMPFQMNTRRRASQTSSQSTSNPSSSPNEPTSSPGKSPPEPQLSPSSPALPSSPPPLESSPRIILKLRPSSSVSPADPSSQPKLVSQTRGFAPNMQSSSSPADSSPLTTPPSALGNTPEGLAVKIATKTQSQTRQTSPTVTGRTLRPRNAKFRKLDNSQEWSVSKKRKHSGNEDLLDRKPENSNLLEKEQNSSIPQVAPVAARPSRKRKARADAASPGGVIKPSTTKAKTEESPKSQPVTSMPTSSNNDTMSIEKEAPKVSKPAPKSRKRKLVDRDQFCFANHKEKLTWPEFNPQKPTYYAADGETEYTGDIQPTSSGTGSPRGRGGGRGRGGRGRGRGGGNGRGRGRGAGKGRGRDGRGDSPDLPRSKQALTEEEQAFLRLLKERQAELKRFYSVVGSQQVGILNNMMDRDLSRLMRKLKAHRQVPEYDDLLEDLEEKKQEAITLAETRRDLQLQLAENELVQETEVLEMQFKTRIEQARKEHLAGVKGDLLALREANDAAQDDTRTETDSVGDYFPRYHESPEHGEHVRGYTSMRVTDETAFKHQLASYDDQVRREVIDDDILAPVAKALEESNKRRKDEQAREKTQNMRALSNEAVRQLSDMRGYLIPRRTSQHEFNSWALSTLADISEWHAGQNSSQAYIYMPLAPGEHFPREALNYDQLPGQQKPPAQPVSQPKQAQPPPAPTTRQFVFQPPQGTTHHQRPVMAPNTGRFAVQFINQTAASRKAGGGGKGQRLLLPKV